MVIAKEEHHGHSDNIGGEMSKEDHASHLKAIEALVRPIQSTIRLLDGRVDVGHSFVNLFQERTASKERNAQTNVLSRTNLR